jgi:hypothetical protein
MPKRKNLFKNHPKVCDFSFLPGQDQKNNAIVPPTSIGRFTIYKNSPESITTDR